MCWCFANYYEIIIIISFKTILYSLCTINGICLHPCTISRVYHGHVAYFVSECAPIVSDDEWDFCIATLIIFPKLLSESIYNFDSFIRHGRILLSLSYWTLCCQCFMQLLIYLVCMFMSQFSLFIFSSSFLLFCGYTYMCACRCV